MTENTKKGLIEFEEVLRSIPLLSCVGEPFENEGKIVKSWKEVHALIAKQNKWLNFRNSIMNVLSGAAFENGVSNDVYPMMKNIRQKFIDESLVNFEIPSVFDKADISGQISYHIACDLSGIGGEILLSKETDDYPKFFTKIILPLYQKGHFPCGWDGKMIKKNWVGKTLDDLPDGKVRVY